MIFRRTRTPRMIQMEAVECGAAALGSILGYYRKFVSLEELRLICGVSRDGVSAYQILEAAKYYGLKGDAYYVEAKDLTQVTTPCILYWEFNHFIVLEKIQGNQVWINDPATGPRTITREELNKRYSGVVMTLEPGENFVKGGKPTSLFEQLKRRFAPYAGKLSYIFLIEIAALLFSLSMPAVSRIFIDYFLPSWLPSWVSTFVWFMVGLVIVTTVITWIRLQTINRLQVATSIQFNAQFVRHLFSLPISFFSQRYPGELLNRIQLNTRLAALFSTTIVTSVVSLISVLIYGVILLYYNVMIALIGIGATIFNFLLLHWINRTRVNEYARLQQAEAATLGMSFDTIDNVEMMKSVSYDTFFFSRIAGHYTNSINASQSIGRKDAFLTTLSGFSVQLTNLLLLAIGAWLIMKGHLTIGMLVAFQILMNYFLTPIGSLVQFGADLQTLKVDMSRIDDVLHHHVDSVVAVEEQNENKPTERLKGNIAFKNVTFGYAPLEEPYIKNFNIDIQSGEVIGIVGPVGSGKSTVAKLATALYLPWVGEVLFDGNKATDLSRETLKYSIGSVDQEIKLFAMSLYDNIALWDPQVTESMVIEAAKAAQLHDEITRFPAGYHTQLQERGVNLSQGQKQRLELARALIYKPSILVLDETLNSLDSETEVKIFENIRKMGVTILLISHRLSTIRQCDRILIMENGSIAGLGTHHDLIRTNEIYHRLSESEIRS